MTMYLNCSRIKNGSVFVLKFAKPFDFGRVVLLFVPKICIWTQPCRDALYIVYRMILLCIVCTAYLYIIYIPRDWFDLSKVHLMFVYRMLFLYIGDWHEIKRWPFVQHLMQLCSFFVCTWYIWWTTEAVLAFVKETTHEMTVIVVTTSLGTTKKWQIANLGQHDF